MDQASADLLEVPEIREALEHIQVSAFTKAELETYDKYWDSIRSERSLLEEAEQLGLEKGIAIYQVWQSGASAEEIAARFELSAEQVRELLRRMQGEE